MASKELTASISETLADQGSKSLFQLVWSLASKYGKKTVDKIKVAEALNNYKTSYHQRNGEIKVLTMSNPIPLNQIYTKVRLIQAYAEPIDVDFEEYELNFRKRSEVYLSSPLDVAEVVSKYSRLNVLGAPGAGKSTLLKHIGLDFLSEDDYSEYHLETTYIPVLLELKSFNGSGSVNIQDALQREFEIAGFPESADFINNALKDGKLIILLDGLDEVSRSLLDDVISSIRDLTHRYPSNRFITSCRTAYYKNFLDGFNDIEVTNFNDHQIQTFITSWFNAEMDVSIGTGNQLISLLFKPENISTLELARTPLLLTFLCIVYDAGQQFPANKSSLYRRALEILLERWAAEKRIHQSDIYQNLNSDIEIQMLAEIAAYFHQSDRILFSKEELKMQISLFLENTMGVKLPPASKVLEAIEVQQGLLVQRMMDVYSFSHLTIQEYLTAFYFSSSLKMPILIEKYCFDRRWREVFILQAGMAHSDDLLLLLTRYLKQYASRNLILSEAINWVNKISKTDDSPEGVCKRIMLLSFLVRYRRKQVDGSLHLTLNSVGEKVKEFIYIVAPNYYENFNLPKHTSKGNTPRILDALELLTNKRSKRNLAVNGIRALVPNRPLNEMLPGSKLTFNRKILNEILKAYDVPERFVNPKPNTFNIIERYIDGLLLLAECRAASLRVSPQAWSEVLGSIIR
ncbi:NACHT domain-containing protein [Pedobacter sp. P351]|uniref:NACHT domain-containing protein n=1 Tax=Pedobacter superstes TaxID=3133441 RepID=UPI0030A1DFCA